MYILYHLGAPTQWGVDSSSNTLSTVVACLWSHVGSSDPRPKALLPRARRSATPTLCILMTKIMLMMTLMTKIMPMMMLMMMVMTTIMMMMPTTNLIPSNSEDTVPTTNLM